jgi:phosphoribosyl-AMP cyclohydrolase
MFETQLDEQPMTTQEQQPQEQEGEFDSQPRLDSQLAGLKFDSQGLVPAIIQDGKTGTVLMMAWMSRDSLAMTVHTGKTHYYSRSRKKLWMKGESSGHVQHVQSIATDCDKDVLLIKVEQVGAACHEGYESCFFREHQVGDDWKVVGNKVFDPDKVYG